MRTCRSYSNPWTQEAEGFGFRKDEEKIMKIRLSKKAEPLSGVNPVLAAVMERLRKEPTAWTEKLRKEPGTFVDLEKDIHVAFGQMADQVVAGILAEVTQTNEFADSAKEKVATGRNAAGKATHRSGEPRPLQIRLLGGLILFVTTLYCAPMARTGKKRGREGGGLYPECGELGIMEGKSPALVRHIGRLTALLPYATVREQLLADGMKITRKEVHGIGVHAGQVALTYRCRELEAYRAGTLAAGAGKGKRFGAQLDGGRGKIRTRTRKQSGFGKFKTRTRRFKSDWREPKVIIVYEMDETGNMKKKTEPIIDGTFRGGPDEIMEILAMRLHQVGASEADVVAFRSDGAPWIWDRLDWVIKRLGLKDAQVSKGLDWCHAAHHVSLALSHVSAGAERKRLFKKYRKWLKAGQWAEVMYALIKMGLAADLPWESELWTATNYLDRHGSAGHLDYATFRRRKLPLGSGAIESTIRRVVNLRIKGNSIHWLEANAEAMLLLRGLVLSGRWDRTFAAMLKSFATDRRLDWAIKSPDMVSQLNAKVEIKPPKAQSVDAIAICGAAA